LNNNPYVKFWYVRSHSDPNKNYKVSQRQDGTYACSCPHWLYRRSQIPDGECKHIKEVKLGGAIAVLVQNPIMVKILSTLSAICEAIEAKVSAIADFDGIWKEANDQKPFLTPVEWTQLEGEILATENFWREHS